MHEQVYSSVMGNPIIKVCDGTNHGDKHKDLKMINSFAKTRLQFAKIEVASASKSHSKLSTNRCILANYFPASCACKIQGKPNRLNDAPGNEALGNGCSEVYRSHLLKSELKSAQKVGSFKELPLVISLRNCTCK